MDRKSLNHKKFDDYDLSLASNESLFFLEAFFHLRHFLDNYNMRYLFLAKRFSI